MDCTKHNKIKISVLFLLNEFKVAARGHRVYVQDKSEKYPIQIAELLLHFEVDFFAEERDAMESNVFITQL